MNTKELKDKLSAANSAYRAGTPIMSDGQFDALLDELKSKISTTEFDAFRKTLFEVKGKVKHPYLMGSLEKLKYEEPKNVEKFINESCTGGISISAKVDGISCRLHYEDGKLVSASTRGNGKFGEDITDKIQFVKSVPQVLGTGKFGDEYKSIDIRGELVILKTDFDLLNAENDGKFANARNACAGIMNRKDWTKDEVKHVSFVAYTILGPQFTKEAQFAYLSSWGGFNVAWNTELPAYYFKDHHLNAAEELFKLASQNFPYETDGLVICSTYYKNEDKYHPDNCKAFKINQLSGVTTLLDVSFEGPAKDGLHTPVAILEPISLGGSEISRATLHNLDFIDNLHLMYGSKILILKSGDVIPHVVKVVSNDPKTTTPIVLPTVCNCCGSPLVRDGVNLRCVNKNCSEQKLTQLYHFIAKLGVKSAAKRTLEKLGIFSFDDLLRFSPDKTKKTQTKLYQELQLKVFSRSKKELLAAMNFVGLAETLISKIVDFYGFDNIEKNNYVGFPSGVGEATLEKFKEDILENLNEVNKIINDSRYNYIQSDVGASQSNSVKKNGMSVCFTGKLNTMSRGEAEAKAIAAGFEVKAVNKKLTYLVTNDTTSGSSKNRKAQELGIKVISEDEFLKMISNTDDSANLFEL